MAVNIALWAEQQGLSGCFLASEKRWLGVREVGDGLSSGGPLPLTAGGLPASPFPADLQFLTRQGREW